MTDVDLATYKNLYLQTARDHLINLRKNLALLGADPANNQEIYEVFRLFHSLKSQNFFMGFEKTAQLCKALEHYFREIKEERKTYDPAVSNIILNFIEKIEGSIDSIDKHNVEIDLSQDIINLEKGIL